MTGRGFIHDKLEIKFLFYILLHGSLSRFHLTHCWI